jgi:hypothetical protein
MGYVSIAFGGSACWSDIALDRGPLQKASDATAALRRSGYEILSTNSKPFHARRPLRGPRELDAEVRRLEALSRDRATIATFPARVLRQPGLPPGVGPFSTGLFNRLRETHAWKLEWVSVGRRGAATFVEAPTWWTGAWCLFLDDGEDRWVDLDVHLFPTGRWKAPSDNDFSRLTRAAQRQLGPFGYRTVKLHRPKGRLYAVFTKRVGTLSEARRERVRLDRIIFGD